MALRALVKTDVKNLTSIKTSPILLYRSMVKELTRVLIIYDIDMPVATAKNAVKYHFRKNTGIEDTRLISYLVAKGYMELEETLMQWKQKSHLLKLLQPIELQPTFYDPSKLDDSDEFC